VYLLGERMGLGCGDEGNSLVPVYFWRPLVTRCLPACLSRQLYD